MMGWAECPQFNVPIRRRRLLLSRLYAASLYLQQLETLVLALQDGEREKNTQG